MAVFSIKSFGGIAPVTPPRYLQDSQAQTALNCPVFRGSIQPLTGMGSTVATLTKTGTPKSIYRFGQDTVSDNNYWFHWLQDVDVCRSQIAGDVSEWTFFTGDGGPKATYNSLALSGSSYPNETRPLGLPAPASACAASADPFTAATHPASLVLSERQISQLSTTYGILISTTTDNADQYTPVTLAGTITAASVAAAIEAKTALDTTVVATSSGGLVTIKSTASGEAAKLFVKYQTGTTINTDGTFTLLSDFSPALSANGTADTDAYVIIDDSEIGSITSTDKIRVSTRSGTTETHHINDVTFNGTATAAGLATWLNNLLGNKITATAYGSCVVLTPDTVGGGTNGTIIYRRKISTATSEYVTELEASGSESAAPATLFVTQSNIDVLEGKYIKLTINGVDTILPVSDPAYVATLRTFSAYGITVETHGAIEPFAVVTTNAVGTASSLVIRGGTYPSVATFANRNAEGYEDEDSTLCLLYTSDAADE